MSRARWVLLALVVFPAVCLLRLEGQTFPGQPKVAPSLKEGVVAASKEKAVTVEKILKAVGPAMADQLKAGRQVEIEGVGVFRVVRIAEHKDLVNGRPAIVPEKRYVEFLPAGSLDAAANSPGAIPARTVEAVEFVINANANPGIRVGTTRNVSPRSR